MNGLFGRVKLPDLNVHDVEALAQKLYEASDPQGIRWAERNLVVRDPWLAVAKKRLLAAMTPRT